MRILHIAPTAPYNEGWGYQENLLPKYQQRLGHEVYLVVTNREHQGAKLVEVPCTDTVTKDGVRVIRRNVQWTKIKPLLNLLSIMDVYDLLCEIKPDIVFYHGLATSTMKQVIRYKKACDPSLTIVQDNHLDYNIGHKLDTLKNRMLHIIEKHLQSRYTPYVAKVYGVTPWRQQYAIENFGVPSKKTDVLIMGADDEKIKFSQRGEIRKRIRERYGITDEDFLIVTGGRIDQRKNIHLLMHAVNALGNVKLLVFGNVLEDVEAQFHEELSENVIWVGFIPADESYNYFFAADLVFFPGQHSVLWEQACAAKVPCVFMKWEGMGHVNNGGNSTFVDPVTVETIQEKIQALQFTSRYFEMKRVAASGATDIYLYSKIAEKSLECVDQK